ncbi:hypothetical protein [Corynebacterium sp. TAE3-ERU12]|uniref:hypothetical protein n=1 Tax=Corynebacterium sp. TAE3-ERU12 TaxID=2849491 RepID=UPI00351D30A4
MTANGLGNDAFAVVDFDASAGNDRAYTPEASLAAARHVSSQLVGHIPSWPLAEPLGLLALAVRECVTGSVVRRLTSEYVSRFDAAPQPADGALGYGRLAYSVLPHHESATNSPALTLHVLADDPIFTAPVLQDLIDRAQAFADVFGSVVDCHATFGDIRTHSVFPSTIHEPDAEDVPILLYKIPLAADLLPVASCAPVVASDGSIASGSTSVVIHRDADSGAIEVRRFIPGQTIIDRALREGGYLSPKKVIAQLQRECAETDPGCLAAAATPAMMSESLATWGLAVDGDNAMRAVRPNVVQPAGDSISQPLLTVEVSASAPPGSVVHEVCDVLDALGVYEGLDFPVEVVDAGSLSGPTASAEPEDATALPCLWPRALGAREAAASGQALALAAVRQALRKYRPDGGVWVGVTYSRPSSSNQHRISVATDTDLPREFVQTLSDICTEHFPDAQVECDIVAAPHADDAHSWVTAAGYHPVFGLLPAYIQLVRRSVT